MSAERDLVLFGERLKAERLDNRLNQAEFAKLGGASTNSQVEYEKARTVPGVNYLLALGRNGIDVGYIVSGQRADSQLSFEQQLLADLLEKLTAREREIVVTMAMMMAGHAVDPTSIALEARSAHTLHDRKREFRGKADE